MGYDNASILQENWLSTMKIYTKTGDAGTTGLLGGHRVPKDDPRIEAYGTVDELNALLGVARAHLRTDTLEAILERLQHLLFAVGAALASPDDRRDCSHWIGDEVIEELELVIDQQESHLEALANFVLPAGTPAGVLSARGSRGLPTGGAPGSDLTSHPRPICGR